jgi:hypothetical protein
MLYEGIQKETKMHRTMVLGETRQLPCRVCRDPAL